ncbi:MAG: NADAR family protein [Butyrivibrio sp.]|nr:NADAR family protein [Butyrivibrio sp.]
MTKEVLLTDETMVGFFHEDEEYGCFSNWYPAEFDYAREHYKNVEQYMMYQKVMMFRQYELAEKIMGTDDPSECKKIGRTHFPEFNSELWDKTCKTIVKRGIRAKFLQNEDLLNTLLGTGNKLLAECSPFDKKWGIGIDINDSDRFDTSKWKGSNLLGRILMEVREELRNELYASGDLGIEYVNALDLDPIPEWNMTAGALKRIPQFYDAIHAYADTLPTKYDERNKFYHDFSLYDWEVAMRTNMGGGLPIIGFYEMKQDVYDIVRRLNATDIKTQKRMNYCKKYIPILQMINDDPDLKESCSDYSAYSASDKHQSLHSFLYGSFMREAYVSDIVIPNYSEVVSEALTDEEVAKPTEEILNRLTTEQIVGCIAWHFRRDHFSEGSLISDSIANGYMLMLLKAFVVKTHV